MRERGVSPALGYVLTLGITLLLVTSLFSASGTLVDTERDRAVGAELSVIGNRLAGQIATADSLVRAGDAPNTVRLTEALPDRVAGGQYRIDIDEQAATGDYYRYLIVLEGDSADVSVSVHLKTGTAVEETTVAGGTVVLAYDASSDTIEVNA